MIFKADAVKDPSEAIVRVTQIVGEKIEVHLNRFISGGADARMSDADASRRAIYFGLCVCIGSEEEAQIFRKLPLRMAAKLKGNSRPKADHPCYISFPYRPVICSPLRQELANLPPLA